MNKYLLLTTAMICTLLFSCKEESTLDGDIEKYISQLKAGSYDSFELPEFSAAQIPDLLEYRNDTTPIHDFPHNPISSLWMDECRLGVYVLWTIESIRQCETGADGLIGRFPSQNPLLGYCNTYIDRPVGALTIQKEAAEAYMNWWSDSSGLNKKLEINPLDSTSYCWY